MIAELEKYPRIARGQLNFVEANHDSGPTATAAMNGIVQVEHDPATLLPTDGVAQEWLSLTFNYGLAPLQQLQFWHEVFECPAPRPDPSASAILRAASTIDRVRLSLRIPR